MPRPRKRNPDDDPAAYLGHYLELFRLSAGIQTQEALAARLKVGRTTVTEAESGGKPPDEVLLATWLKACRVSPDRLVEVVCGLARNREKSVPTWFRDFTDVERAAHTIRSWHPMIWPGLVQTEDYARELLHLVGIDPDMIEPVVTARMERQKILDSSQLELTVVVDVQVLNRQLGTNAMMAAQCDYALELCKRPNVSVLVVPGGVNAGHVGALTIASTRGRPDVLLYEGVQDTITSSTRLLLNGRRIWERILSDSLPMRSSMVSIMEARDRWNSQ